MSSWHAPRPCGRPPWPCAAIWKSSRDRWRRSRARSARPIDGTGRSRDHFPRFRWAAGLPGSPVRSIKGSGTRTDMAAARILVVDDHAESAEVLAQLLRQAGHHVTVALSLADAVTAAASIPMIDAVISDISLPEIG